MLEGILEHSIKMVHHNRLITFDKLILILMYGFSRNECIIIQESVTLLYTTLIWRTVTLTFDDFCELCHFIAD